jgi:hypothetical protein
MPHDPIPWHRQKADGDIIYLVFVGYAFLMGVAVGIMIGASK